MTNNNQTTKNEGLPDEAEELKNIFSPIDEYADVGDSIFLEAHPDSIFIGIKGYRGTITKIGENGIATIELDTRITELDEEDMMSETFVFYMDLHRESKGLFSTKYNMVRESDNDVSIMEE